MSSFKTSQDQDRLKAEEPPSGFLIKDSSYPLELTAGKKRKATTEINSAAVTMQWGGNTGILWNFGASPPPPSVLGLLVRLRERLMGCESIERRAPEPPVCVMRLITEIPNYIPGLSLTC